MSIYLLDDLWYPHSAQVQVHFLAIFCGGVSVDCVRITLVEPGEPGDQDALSLQSRISCLRLPLAWIVGSGHVLNLTPSVAGSWLFRGSIVDSIFMPSARAFGGMSDRNSRAGFERGLKGLKVTRTSVRNLVIIVGAAAEAEAVVTRCRAEDMC